ncbi:MAG: hypothetical protein R3A10_11575 [Caldilineaceae bacterium]
MIATALGLVIATRGSYSVPATVAGDPTLPQVTIDRVTFHAETFSDPAARSVIVVHGGPGGDYGVLAQPPRLAGAHTTSSPDQRRRTARPGWRPRN